MNRLTITLDDDVYAMIRSHAIAKRTSLSKAIADLMRQGRTDPVDPAGAADGLHPVSGFPVSVGDGRILSNLDVQRASDDDLFSPMEFVARRARFTEPRPARHASMMRLQHSGRTR